MPTELDELHNLWQATAEPDDQTRAVARARLFAEIAAEPPPTAGSRTARSHSRSRPRVLLAVAAGVIVVAAAGAGIAAGVGAFSGTTIDQARACVPSMTALTTASGARVLTGHTDAGVSCVAYEDTNGAGGGTAGRLGESPAGDVLAGKTQGVVFGLVPAGYDTLTLGSAQIPIVNHAFVVDPKLVVGPGTLSGPAGQTTINLSELAAGP
jgi:hypothetical protein